MKLKYACYSISNSKYASLEIYPYSEYLSLRKRYQNKSKVKFLCIFGAY